MVPLLALVRLQLNDGVQARLGGQSLDDVFGVVLEEGELQWAKCNDWNGKLIFHEQKDNYTHTQSQNSSGAVLNTEGCKYKKKKSSPL